MRAQRDHLRMLVGLLGLLLLAAGCDGRLPFAGDPPAPTVAPLALADGWVTGLAWPEQTVVALRSVSLGASAKVDGDVAVIATDLGQGLSGDQALAAATNAEFFGNVSAQSITLQVAAQVHGDATYNALTGAGTVDGTSSSPLLLPLPITIVSAPGFVPGSKDVTLGASRVTQLKDGSYRTLTLEDGTSTEKTVLFLKGGVFLIDELVVGDHARVECRANRGGNCEMRVKKRLVVGDNSYIGPTAGKLVTTMRLFVEGGNGAGADTTDASALPRAAAVGQLSELKALTFVPNGTLSLGPSTSNVGKFVAHDVEIAQGATLMSAAADQATLPLPYVVGPSWPEEVVTAWNSVHLTAGSRVEGDVAVISDGTGPFLSTAEGTIGPGAYLLGDLWADAVDIQATSRVNGTVHYNRGTLAGAVMWLDKPIEFPLPISVPVFPTITTGKTKITVPASVDQAIVSGRYAALEITGGTSGDPSIVRLSGGLYEMRSLTIGPFSSLLCDAPCEVRVRNVIDVDADVTIGPGAGVDIADVEFFVEGRGAGNTPTATPYAVSIGERADLSAFIFAPLGTIDVEQDGSLSGRFVAKDVRIAGGGTTESGGTTVQPPAIVTGPQSLMLFVGQDANFDLSATGTDVVFQWNLGGSPISGETGGTLLLPAVTLADDRASITVTVSNSAGSVTSEPAILSVANCDPMTHVPSPTSCGVGACGATGTLLCLGGVAVDTCAPGTPAPIDATCDGVDDDCNGLLDDDYVSQITSCAMGACASTGRTSCVAGNVVDSCVSRVPAPNDATCDGRDDDCDGSADEDYAQVVTSCGVGSCASTGSTSCDGGAIQDSCTEGDPAPTDDNCNGIDEDCSGEADDGYEPVATTCGVGACQTNGETACVDGQVVDDCRAGNDAPDDPTCDGVDDDCDGSADEDYLTVATACGVGVCASSGVATCVSGVLQNSCSPGTPSASTDLTCDGVDQDCSGAADEDYVSQATSCGAGACLSSGATSCVAGGVQDSCAIPADDADSDGVPDCADGCPGDAGKSDPGVCGCGTSDADTDLDGTEDCNDACPLDAADDVDGDGLCADVDNCPLYANAGQEDVDDDGLGDVCDGLSGVRIAAGGSHACAVLPDARVACWGANSKGQLGDATTTAANGPVVTSGITDAVEVAAGDRHSCALRATGAVVCWGANASGQLGDAGTTDSSVPVAVSGLLDAIQISAGDLHSCAVRSTGGVVCWGDNVDGRLGNGSYTRSSVPVAVTGITDAVHVTAGSVYSCAAHATGSVSCWGANGSRQLGNGTTTPSPLPVAVTGVTDGVSVEAGGLHACAVRSTGAVACWGANASGQLGDGSTTLSGTPVAVSGLADATRVTAGNLHSCAVRASGAAVCWGSGSYGQLGSGSTQTSTTPVAVSGVSTAVYFSAGDLHTCAVDSSNAVLCFGRGNAGELGNRGGSPVLSPADAPGVSSALQVSVGSYHSCVRSSAGDVQCTGTNSYGELGDGSTLGGTTFGAVSGLTDATALAAGDAHTCAIRSGGSAVCWGYGWEGQLGDGNGTASTLPVAVSGVSDATDIASGMSHSCVRRATGAVLCWGYGYSGQLGDGLGAASNTPVSVSGVSDAVGITTGASHTCALRGTGQVECWGYGDQGQLGDGASSSASTAVPVSGLSDAIAVSAGGYHSCALRSTGAVSCWGANWEGQLGDGLTADRGLPADVSNITTAVEIECGSDYSCARLASGAVSCWGANWDGQLGDGSRVSRLTPVLVPGISSAVSLSAGYAHTCAVLADGRTQCWGAASIGQLGNSYPWSSIPVQVAPLAP